MRRSARLVPSAIASALALAFSITAALPHAAAERSAPDQQRQRDFTSAATEFGVPADVLLAVSYLESRWDTHGGSPSTSAGYGPMHLTDALAANAGSHHSDGTEDPRGDDSRPALLPTATAPAAIPPSLHTIDVAAKLINVDVAALRTDSVANIRGGAALLAQYQRELGVSSTNTADWFGAIARYSGATDTAAATSFANEVFATLRQGADRVTDDGQHVLLAASPGLAPNTAQLGKLGLRVTSLAETDCPSDLGCEWIPAPYEKTGPGPGDYGNHDLANRPYDQKIDYIIIHDTEGTWDGVLKLVQDPNYVSWHYTLRSNDGHVAQHVRTKDVGWHAGNWYVNAHSVGLEHEGFAKLGTWYTEAMYRTSSKLVAYLAKRYGIPLNREHILGHDNVPGTTPTSVKGMHWDPGPYWDWAHYFELLGAPLHATGNAHSGMVTIAPDFATNQPAFYGCDPNAPSAPCPPRGSSSVILHTQPDANSPLLVDLGLHPDGTPSTMYISDHGSRVATGQQWAVAGRSGDWTAVWYLGQKGWFYNPDSAPAAKPATGLVATPKPGRTSIPVYGRAYPEKEAYPPGVPAQSIVPLQYTFPAGQRYTVGQVVQSEYYYAVNFDGKDTQVVRGNLRYVEIQFGHRVMYVNLDDVTLLPSWMS